MGLFSAAEEVPKGALERFAPFGWETFPDYLAALERGPLGLNVRHPGGPQRRAPLRHGRGGPRARRHRRGDRRHGAGGRGGDGRRARPV